MISQSTYRHLDFLKAVMILSILLHSSTTFILNNVTCYSQVVHKSCFQALDFPLAFVSCKNLCFQVFSSMCVRTVSSQVIPTTLSVNKVAKSLSE